jgi:hypothetical protein
MSAALTHLYSALEHSKHASPRTQEMVRAAITHFILWRARKV